MASPSGKQEGDVEAAETGQPPSSWAEGKSRSGQSTLPAGHVLINVVAQASAASGDRNGRRAAIGRWGGRFDGDGDESKKRSSHRC